MNEEMTNTFDERSVIDDCARFLSRSDSRFSSTMKRAVNDLQRYSGNFWDTETRKQYRKNKNRLCLSLNNWNTMANAISSPISNSPWHTELCDKQGDAKYIQENIDDIEAENDNKSALIDGFRKEILAGYGFLVLTTVEDEFTGDAKIIVETVQHIDSVAMDPSITTVDGSDAEEGAIINYIPVKKAKRLYGEDVVPFTYPDAQCIINFTDKSQWKVPADCVAIVSYYVKNENGFVDFYKICGDKIVEHIELPIKMIPIFRLAGNEIYEDGEINYNGLIQQTMSLELGANIAYSTMIERCGRSPKAGYLTHVDAIDGLEETYAKANLDDSATVLWKGEHQPVPLHESFETADLQNTISTCRLLLEDTVGVPLTGIEQNRPEKTATEILRQQISQESNTANYYNNAFKAVRSLSRCIIQMLTGGQDLKFTLENGPSVITRDMKIRQELQAMSTMVPDTMKPVIAKYFADTLKDDIGDELAKNIVANLPPEVQFITDIQDPAAIHQIKQLQAQFDQAIGDLEQMKAQNEQLKLQLTQTQLAMLDHREDRDQEWQKFKIQETDKMALESAKLDMQATEGQADFQIKTEKNMIDAEKNMADAENEHDKIALKAAEDVANLQKGYDDLVNNMGG